MSDIDWKKILEEDGDPFGIENSAKKSSAQTPQTRLQEKFEEINIFIDKNNRLPEQGKDPNEIILYYRLKNYKPNEKKVLKTYDRHNILSIESEDINSVDDILNDDEFNDLFGDEDDIFELKHVKSAAERQKTDFVARRKHCKDFEKYEPLFKQCQNDLKNGIRKLTKFEESQIEEGRFFVVQGLFVYVDKLFHISKTQVGDGIKYDGRTHLIFENGTESNMRFRSLGKLLYKNGFYVSRSQQEMEEDIKRMSETQTPTGVIYILKSQSKDEQVKNIADLYKIGFSTTDIKIRLKNTQSETTYLMAPVKIMATFDTFDMNTQKFEDLLHKFFDTCRVNIDVYDNNGTKHTVREWFQAPYNQIVKAIDLLESGEIVNYKYDRDLKQIVPL